MSPDTVKELRPQGGASGQPQVPGPLQQANNGGSEGLGVLPLGDLAVAGQQQGGAGIGACARPAGDDRLPNDYARCAASRCEVREICARYTAECRSPVSMIDPSTYGPTVTRIEACSSFIANSKARPIHG